jgi:hypothetical protein
MDINLLPLITILGPLLLAALLAAIAVLTPRLVKLLHLHITASQEQQLQVYITREANLLYGHLISAATPLAALRLANPTLAMAATAIASDIPQVVQALGLTPDAVQLRVKAALGGLVAGDPTVSVVTPGTNQNSLASSPPPAAVSASAGGAAPIASGAAAAVKVLLMLFALSGAFMLSACVSPSTNTTGSATNAAQQTVASMYGVYDGAVSLELSWLKLGHATKAQADAVEALRITAYNSLHQMMVLANEGKDTTAQQVLVQTALNALSVYEANNGINALPTTTRNN